MKKSRKSGSPLVGNKAVFQRMRRETEEAISRYLSAVNRKGLLRGSALYERPWFLCVAQQNQENRHSFAVQA